MIINKKEFCDVINRIENCYKLQDSINDLFRKCIDNSERDFMNAGSICIMLEVPLLKVLEAMFEDEDLISWWIYELDFGKKFKVGYLIEKNGDKPDLSTAEKLYDYLVKGLENDL